MRRSTSLARSTGETEAVSFAPSLLTTGWTSPASYVLTRLPVDEATTMPGAVYHDPIFHEVEKKRLWRNSWVAVAELADVCNPGDVLPVTVAGQPLLLAMDNKGTLRCFHNVCRHRGAQLVDKKCEKRRTILCPYHRWGYALDGRLVGTPAFDADESGKAVPERLREKYRTHHVKDFDQKSMSLYPVRMETALGMAFVNLSDDAPPLREWLGDILVALDEYLPALETPGELVATYRKTYKPASDWKILVENFLEYYHLPAVHPALCDVSGVDEHERRQGTGMYMCFATDPLNGDSTSGTTALDPGRLKTWPGLSAKNTNAAWHISIFPNVFFSLYPDNFFRVILQTEGPGRAVENATLLTHRDSPAMPGADKTLEEIFDFWDNVNTEDIDICEKVQIGTGAEPYAGGRFSFRFEEPLHRFQNMVVDKMVGEPSDRIPNGDGTPY